MKMTLKLNVAFVAKILEMLARSDPYKIHLREELADLHQQYKREIARLEQEAAKRKRKVAK